VNGDRYGRLYQSRGALDEPPLRHAVRQESSEIKEFGGDELIF